MSIEAIRDRFEATCREHARRRALFDEEEALTRHAQEAVLAGREPVLSADAIRRVLEIHEEIAHSLGRATLRDHIPDIQLTLTIFGVPLRRSVRTRLTLRGAQAHHPRQ